MDAVRRIWREQAFRIGMQVISGAADSGETGRAYADLADACVGALAPAALRETVRLGGRFPGEVAVVALGKFGSREMTAGSDLDLMTLYLAEDPAAMSDVKGWAPETFYGRFTQRLIAALSAPTAEGGLYDIDMQLRPSGAKGPVAVSLAAFESYYEAEAQTWEFLALTRARPVWATSPAFAARVRETIERALRRPRDAVQTAVDVRDMRALMERERPARGFWDLKLSPGGQVDVEFAAQYLQIVNAATGGPLRAGTLPALDALAAGGLAPDDELEALARSWRLHQDVAQMLRTAVEGDADPTREPEPFRRRLARAAGAVDVEALARKLDKARLAARRAFENILSARDGGS
jgi:glutamate-ammonia-ligase adenylyltransferase